MYIHVPITPLLLPLLTGLDVELMRPTPSKPLLKWSMNITVTINTTKQPQYLPKISDISATTVAFFELITLR